MTPPTLPSRYCGWDSVHGDGSITLRLVDTHWQERQRKRLEFLSSADPEVVADELNRRVTHWSNALSGDRSSGRGVGGCVGAAPFPFFAVIASAYGFFVRDPLVLGAALAGFVLLMLPVELKNRQRRSVRHCLRYMMCPTCGYELGGVGGSSGGGRRAPMGPSACPECGAPWPLVPPPVGRGLMETPPAGR